ncbi:hypothetical protein O3M35_001380 [Rhynocoris fuscipes]|uniref:Uncharacterized protein n=1 Tax=Rhynocoris fuscipes TaxID=488301 RepID=A0AAW1CM88_9HEMI
MDFVLKMLHQKEEEDMQQMERHRDDKGEVPPNILAFIEHVDYLTKDDGSEKNETNKSEETLYAGEPETSSKSGTSSKFEAGSKSGTGLNPDFALKSGSASNPDIASKPFAPNPSATSTTISEFPKASPSSTT